MKVLADDRRRRALDVLQSRAAPVSELDLATALVAAERGKPLVDVTRDEATAVSVDLEHAHLPALDAAGLVEWDAAKATVETTDHVAFGDPRFQRIVATEADGWSDVVACLADERRRVVLAALEDRDAPVTEADLAREVAVRETDGEPSEETIEDVTVSLHHVHLPKLDAAGLVEWDADDETVVYEGHPDLEPTWFDFERDETPRSVLPTGEYSDDVWTIEGRSDVLARGQSLIRQADDEVFLMFTTDGLLEEECFRVIRDAVDRGVDVYLGSQTAAVRDQVRERTPGVTIWEPQLDWLNLPPQRERLGRLVLVDREAIMLGTLGAENEDGVDPETAITGEGENNGLVVLMRELLGSRLDHLDAQSEDFRSQIPL